MHDDDDYDDDDDDANDNVVLSKLGNKNKSGWLPHRHRRLSHVVISQCVFYILFHLLRDKNTIFYQQKMVCFYDE